MMKQLEGKVALVTGGAQGIGRAVCEELANAGATVIVADIQAEPAEKTAAEMAADGATAKGIAMNVADMESVQTAVGSIIEEFKSVDFLINNAGITRDNLLMRMKEEEWSSVVSVNLSGVFNCTKSVVRYMMKRRFGRIVNIASVIGQMGNAGQSNYGASKAGVIGFTKSSARELASRNITVNAITPGFIVSAMTDKLTEEQKDAMLASIPLARLGEPQDVARAVKFLVSEDASYITGAVLNVNGGMYM
jgi:3-oxoacyl-[acyl-carrier protein] reductase